MKITITDHNAFSDLFEQFSPSLVGIIDHHNEQPNQNFPSLLEKEIVTVGSASTLVAERYLGTTPIFPGLLPLDDFDPLSLIDNTLSHLLISAILIDTSNLKKRTTIRDTKAVENLVKSMIKFNENFILKTKKNRKKLFKLIKKAKNDITQLTSLEILKKDFKSWKIKSLKYGISSVTVSIPDLLKDQNFLEKINELSILKNISILFVLSHFKSKFLPQRQLLFFSNSNEEKKLNDFFEISMKDLTLKPLIVEYSKNELFHIRSFSLTDISLSRKIIQPIIHSSFEKVL